MSDHNGDLLLPTSKFFIYVHCADSHFHLGEYRKAESLYKKSLQFRKFLLKAKGATKPNQETHKDLLSDVDIKYQIHVCLMKLKSQLEALQVLQSIPGKQRTPKVSLYFFSKKVNNCQSCREGESNKTFVFLRSIWHWQKYFKIREWKDQQ